MIRFLLRRLGWSVLVLWFVVSATFAMMYAIPADPARAVAGKGADEATLARVRKAMCLDRGFFGQYQCYVGDVMTGNFGKSSRTGRPVSEILWTHAWPTLQLAFMTVFFQVLFGVPLGIIAALRRDRPADYAASVTALIGQSAPTFFIGPLFLYLLAFKAGWFPVGGYGEGFWGRLHHIFLPAMTMAVVGIAYYARLARGEMIEVMQEDYVRTARAKGLSERRVVLKHALRNALGPVVTLIGLDLGILMGGAIVTEYIFSWPGLGREALRAVLEFDPAVVLGVVFVTAVAILIANLLVDLVYAALDPRVRLE